MKELTFRVKDPTNIRPGFLMAFNAARPIGEPFEIVLRSLKAKRSGDQNRRLWKLYREMASVVWVNGRQYSDEVWHEHCKRTFIGMEEITLPDGSIEKRGISTTTLTVNEMGHYMTQIEQWCAEIGFPVMTEAA